MRRLIVIVALAVWCAPSRLAAKPRPSPSPSPGRDVCAGRPGCRVVEETSGGPGLRVVKAALPREESCEPFEHWLVPSGGAPVRLLETCNDGYGAAGVGEDSFAIGPDRFEHVQSGGSAWRWTETRVLGLRPLRRRLEKSEGGWTLGLNAYQRSWSWDDFAGRVAWFVPRCGAEKDAPSIDLDPADPNIFAYRLIPDVALDRAYRDGGWRTTALDRCAAGADFTVYGSGDGATDASLRVVASSGELFAEVHDDKLVGPGRRWLVDDHLELWTSGAALPDYYTQCLGAPSRSLRQWAIRIADGAVFPAHGKPAASDLRVEHTAPAGGVARFKIRLPPATKALAVVYSDSDTGKRQDWLIATSKLRHARQHTLGTLVKIAPGDATCRVVGGKLEPVVRAPFTPE